MQNDFNLYGPIPPVKPMDGWRGVRIAEESQLYNEPLVPLGMFAGHEHSKIFTDSMYFGGRKTSPYAIGEIDGALITCFVRQSVAEALLFANALLPPGHALIIWDAYRPERVQRALFDDFHAQLVRKGYDPEAARIDAQQFVSIPSLNPLYPSPHVTGGSVDVGIIKFDEADLKEMQKAWNTWRGIRNDNGAACAAELVRYKGFLERSKVLDMGVKFDQVSKETALRYYEEILESGGKLSAVEAEQSINRRMLSNVMRAAGFANYPHEPWHFDWGNQFYGHQYKIYAVYGVANFSASNAQFENERLRDYRVLAGSMVDVGNHLVMPLNLLAQKGIKEIGIDPVYHPVGCRLDASVLSAQI